MMEALRQWVSSLVIIILCNHFITLIIPSSRFRDYIRLVLGLFFILMLLQPIWGVLDIQGADIVPFAGDMQWPGNILGMGEALEEHNQGMILEQYGEAMAQQIETMARTHPQVQEAQARITLNTQGEIVAIFLEVLSRDEEQEDESIGIDPITIGERKYGVLEDRGEKNRIAEEIRGILANFFALSQDIIEVLVE